MHKSCFESFLDISRLVASCVLMPPSLFSCEKYFEEALVTIFTVLSTLCEWQGQSGTFIGTLLKLVNSKLLRKQVRGGYDTSSDQLISPSMLVALKFMSGVFLILILKGSSLASFFFFSLIVWIIFTPFFLSNWSLEQSKVWSIASLWAYQADLLIVGLTRSTTSLLCDFRHWSWKRMCLGPSVQVCITLTLNQHG